MAGQPLVLQIHARQLPGARFESCRKVRVGLQVREEHVGMVDGDARNARWEVHVQAVNAGAGGGMSLRGPAIHGSTKERFLYLAWVGRPEGQATETRFRRAKLQLDAVSPELLGRCLREGRALVAELGLTDAKGGPLCASVRPPLIEWKAGHRAGDRAAVGDMVAAHAHPARRSAAHHQPPRPVRGRGDR